MLMMRKNFRSSGFTLTELLVALVINALIFIFLVGLFISNLNHYNLVLNTNRLNEQLEGIMMMMSADIRRAGYWGNANSLIGTNTNTNPFMVTGTTDVTVGGTGNDCILFTYDHNSDGVLPAISSASDDERYGYRLNGTYIQTRPWGASFSCSAAANAWENMNDSTITITALTFTLTTETVTTGPGAQGITTRSIDISLRGDLTSNTAITKTLTQHIRISNDKFVP
jgi:prepilin peptidase dependent protein B